MYGIPSLPGKSGTPFFTRSNITDFLVRYNDIYKDYGVSKGERLRRVYRYYNTLIEERIQTMKEYMANDWEELQKKLKKHFKDTDVYQQMRIRAYLQILADKPREAREVGDFN